MLKPNNKQNTKLFGCAGMARFAYNWALEKVKENYENEIKFVDDKITVGIHYVCRFKKIC